MIMTFLAAPAFFLTVTATEPQQATTPAATTELQNRIVALPEEHDIGLVDLTPRSCAPIYGTQVATIGPETGDPEKDNYARTAVSEACR